MEKYLIKGKRKETESDPHSNKWDKSSKHTETRKYDNSYLSLGLLLVERRDRSVCYLNILEMNSMKPSKFKRHLET